jgi:hypothetical protein
MWPNKYYSATLRALFLALTLSVSVQAEQTLPVDPDSGLAIDAHWQEVKAMCTICHSAKLITQNRMSRQGWLDTIHYMQKEHGLGPLGGLETPILNYLAKHYDVPKNIKRRRKNL